MFHLHHVAGTVDDLDRAVWNERCQPVGPVNRDPCVVAARHDEYGHGDVAEAILDLGPLAFVGLCDLAIERPLSAVADPARSKRPDDRLGSAAMEIELQYRGLGSRMVGFGPAAVTWGFRKPETFGPYDLAYDRLGTRLTAIGPFEIEHDLLGTRPIRLGRHGMVYDRFASRLRSIGPFAVEYGLWGSRIKSIGPFQVSYDRLGTRPKWLRTFNADHEGRQLDDETAAMLFFVLTVIRNRQQSSGDSGAD